MGAEVTGGERNNLEEGLNRLDDFSCRQLGRTLHPALLIGVACDRQPKPAFIQVVSHAPDEPPRVALGVERMEASPVEHKAEGSALNSVLEKIGEHETTFNMGRGSLSPRLVKSDA